MPIKMPRQNPIHVPRQNPAIHVPGQNPIQDRSPFSFCPGNCLGKNRGHTHATPHFIVSPHPLSLLPWHLPGHMPGKMPGQKPGHFSRFLLRIPFHTGHTLSFNGCDPTLEDGTPLQHHRHSNRATRVPITASAANSTL